MNLRDAIRDLEDRFLKPWDRSELDRLRAATSIDQLAARLGPACPWPTAGRQFVTARGKNPRPAPHDLRQAVLFAASRAAMDAAETAAHTFAERLWRELDRAGPPPTDMRWAVWPWGVDSQTLDHERAWSSLQSERVMARIGGRPKARLEEFTGPFASAVRHLHDHRTWDAAVRAGQIDDPGPAEALVDIWRTGCGIRAIHPECIRLFVPSGPPGPTRSGRTPLLQQAFLDAELCRVCLTVGSDVADLEEALARGADPNGRAIAVLPPRHRWLGEREPGWLASSPHVAMTMPWYAFRGGPSPLALLAWRPDTASALDQLRELVAAGADPGRHTRWGNVLAVAARPGMPLSAQAMIDAGVDPHTTDRLGRTALHHLAGRRARPVDVAAVRRLLAAGLDPNWPDDFGETPLHLATPFGGGVLEALLDGGADAGRVNARGESALHVLARRARHTSWRLQDQRGRRDVLIEAGCTEHADHRGLRPRDYGQPRFRVATQSPVAVPNRPDFVQVPRALVPQARHPHDAGSWQVLADWLTEHDDPRGPVLAAVLGGGVFDEDELEWLEEHQWQALCASAPLAWPSPPPHLSFFAGVMRHAAVHAGRVPRLAEHLAHPVLSTLRHLTLEAPDGETLALPELFVEGLTLVHPDEARGQAHVGLLQELRLRRLKVRHPGPLTLTGASATLEQLTLARASALDLAIDAPRLTQLTLDDHAVRGVSVRLPNVRNLRVDLRSAQDVDHLAPILPSRIQRLEVTGLEPRLAVALTRLRALASVRVRVHTGWPRDGLRPVADEVRRVIPDFRFIQ